MSDRGISSEEADKENEWMGKMPKHLIRSKATLVRTFINEIIRVKIQ
jgi:hypothetical protein